jgi:lysozyme family protein
MSHKALFDAIREVKGAPLTGDDVALINKALGVSVVPSEVSASPLTADARFRRCLAEVLKHEGGWADHPKDPGGATMKGVTIAVFREYKGRAVTKDELRNISDDDLEAIYRVGYWDKVRGDDLPAGVDLMVFDLAVNSGPSRAARFLQGAVGADADGVIGPKTLERVKATSATEIIAKMDDRREEFYRSLSTFATFGRGWMRRLDEVTKQALEWA